MLKSGITPRKSRTHSGIQARYGGSRKGDLAIETVHELSTPGGYRLVPRHHTHIPCVTKMRFAGCHLLAFPINSKKLAR